METVFWIFLVLFICGLPILTVALERPENRLWREKRRRAIVLVRDGHNVSDGRKLRHGGETFKLEQTTARILAQRGHVEIVGYED